MNDTNGHREQLESRAAEVRQRLEKRLSMIDERRHRMVDVARAAARPPASVIILAAVGVAASLFILQRVRARRARASSLSYLVRPPPMQEKSFLVQGLQKAAASLVVAAVQRIGKRSLDRLIAEGPPEPRAF